jgi:hypothetical protein
MRSARIWVAVVVSLWAPSTFARCGVQRWDVKTGKDAEAPGISLSSPAPTTIAFLTDLVRFPPPAHWPPPSRVSPVEQTYWTVDAILDGYKFENDPQTGDSDYHLILKDAAGNTMVAEIPFPQCTQGSIWGAQIASTRTAFDSRFTPTSSMQSAQNLPVRVTGIAMYDKLAHGSGHSPNGLEIHPILSIEFNPGAAVTPTATSTIPAGVTPSPTRTPTAGTPVSPSPTPTRTPTGVGGEVIQNGDFEDGEVAWDGSPGVITNQGQAHLGFWFAWLGGYGKVHTDVLEQTVDVPAGSSSLELSFWLRIKTAEVQDKVFDTLKVQITDEGGTVLKTLHTFSNRAAESNPNYERVHFDVTPFLGQRLVVRFTCTEDGAKATSFFVDSVTLARNP